MAMIKPLDESYWSSRWETGQTGWDIGYPSTPLTGFIDLLQNHSARILIPGGGNGHEAAYLWNKGFREVYLLDIASHPLEQFALRHPDFPTDHLLHEDFFAHSGRYDMILEQTFFCALEPSMRDNYVRKTNELLEENGRIAGVLFHFPLTEEGPPFGGSESEYRSRFAPFFFISKMELCTTSIAPRQGRELFIELVKMG